MAYSKKRASPGSRRKTKSKRKAPKGRAAQRQKQQGPTLKQTKAFLRAKYGNEESE